MPTHEDSVCVGVGVGGVGGVDARVYLQSNRPDSRWLKSDIYQAVIAMACVAARYVRESSAGDQKRA